MKNKVPKLRFPEFSGEWEENRFSELVKDNKKITYGVVKPGGYFENGICLIKASDYSKKWNLNNLFKISKELDNSYKRSRVQEGDILFTIVGSVGNIAIVPPELSNSNITQQTARMSINENFSNIFIYNFLMTTFNKIQIRNYLKEGVQPSINLSDLEKFLIIIPSLPEQEKIASFLSKVDIKIEKLEKKKELLSQYKKGTMQKLFSKKLRFKDENGNDYPEWEEKRLKEVGNIITGSTPETSKKEYYGGEYLFVSPIDINSNRYIKNTKTTLTKIGFSKGRKVPKMSVCFVCIGSTIGKIGQNFEECITNQQINSIVPFENIIPDFIYSLLEYSSNKIKLLAAEQAVPLINKTDFSKIKINLPSLREQEKIANFLSSIDRKIELVEQELEKNKEFKKGLLQQMFV